MREYCCNDMRHKRNNEQRTQLQSKHSLYTIIVIGAQESTFYCGLSASDLHLKQDTKAVPNYGKTLKMHIIISARLRV